MNGQSSPKEFEGDGAFGFVARGLLKKGMMYINQFIQRLRPFPQKLSLKSEIFFSGCIVLLGLVFGLVAKATDSISVLGEIGTEIGIWVFMATLIAAYSRYPLSAALNVFLFFLAMLLAYYAYGQIVLGFFPQAYFMGWLMLAMVSPFAGFLAWFARAKGMTGSIVTALPAALLFAHGYPAFYTYRFTLCLSLLMGIVLCIALPRTAKQKIIALGMAIPVAFLVDRLYLLRFLPV